MKSKSFESVPSDVQQVFWSYVDRSGGDDACWLWLSQRLASGYPRFRFKTHECLASRLAFSLVQFPLPAESRLARDCDNSLCVNPRHFHIEEQEERVCVECGQTYCISPARVRQGRSRFCGTPCRRAWFASPERLWEHVEKTDTCWLWQGCVDDSGYGLARSEQSNVRAHRLAWTLAHGLIPSGLWVLHTCDVRLCCRPDHLYLGTVQDNNRDRDERHRQVAPRGEQSYFAKLTDEEVREIRTMYEQGGYTLTAIGELFGVTQASISSIVHRKTWKHLS